MKKKNKLINYKNSPEMLKYNVLIYLDCSSKYKDCINGREWYDSNIQERERERENKLENIKEKERAREREEKETEKIVRGR